MMVGLCQEVGGGIASVDLAGMNSQKFLSVGKANSQHQTRGQIAEATRGGNKGLTNAILRVSFVHRLTF